MGEEAIPPNITHGRYYLVDRIHSSASRVIDYLVVKRYAFLNAFKILSSSLYIAFSFGR